MKWLFGSTRKTAIQRFNCAATFSCNSERAPIPTASRNRPLRSLKAAISQMPLRGLDRDLLFPVLTITRPAKRRESSSGAKGNTLEDQKKGTTLAAASRTRFHLSLYRSYFLLHP